MPELTPIPSAPRPAEPQYQPVSGYAVAAAVAAGLFAAFLLVVAGVAATTRRAAFSYELLLLPAVGLVLAVIGRSQIRNSDGTRTGLKLTAASWWVCVLGGAGFLGYLLANAFVIERESGRRADEFFNELRAGRVQHAFVFLLPPEERNRAAPESPDEFEAAYHPVGYTAYRNSDLVALFRRNPGAVEVERAAGKDIGQDSNGLRATHLYRLRCPEGTFEATVKLVATESRKGGKPDWHIPNLPNPGFTLQVRQLSQYGRLVIELRQEGEAVGQAWMNHLAGGHPVPAQLMTTPAAHRQAVERELTGAIALGGPQAVVMPLSPAFLPADRRPKDAPPADLAYADLAGIGFFRRDDAGTPLAAEKLEKVREAWRPPLVTPSILRQGQTTPVPIDATQISLTPDQITVEVGADLHGKERSFLARAPVGVECTSPEVLAAVNAARQRGADAKDDGSTNLRALPARDWRVAWMRTDAEFQNPDPLKPRPGRQ